MIALFRNLQIRSKLMVGYSLIFVIATLAGGGPLHQRKLLRRGWLPPPRGGGVTDHVTVEAVMAL